MKSLFIFCVFYLGYFMGLHEDVIVSKIESIIDRLFYK